MKIVYFYQYFSTPKGSWGTRVYEFAKEWVEQGHDVTVVTSVYSKSDLKAEKLLEDQVHEGIKLKVINVRIDNKQPFLKRIWTFVFYSLLSSWYALTLPADLVIASSGPITVGLPGLLARFFRGRTLVFETRDLWPEGAIELGIIRNKWMVKLAYWFEGVCYRNSKLIVALSPGMKQYIEAKSGHPNVISVTNAANIELFARPVAFKAIHPELQAGQYAIYTGNIGLVNNSYLLLNAARYIKAKGISGLRILIIGDGQLRDELVRVKEQEGLDSLIIHGLIPKVELVGLIQHALASLVPLQNSPILDTSSPNKFFESLAAGVPVIQNTQGWMKDFLDGHQVGYTIRHDDAEALVRCLIELREQPALHAQMGEKAQVIARAEFDKDVLARRFRNALEKLNPA
ncbi:glycosyltransferase family 4 protein [Algoriphagus sp. H41]|uniref:Glycosyltransferase family 4 protein n=1 Tax=Algoriphagus oliviformis TaxID=2811231 RepID=A0ABS3C720_9BACT|nr:glycosyltransferase family 4 protein [Algoriphagus oliviformis]MBN7812914.1 glycosyltransferase family 4 protein [Algoriphagus oliviformis]